MLRDLRVIWLLYVIMVSITFGGYGFFFIESSNKGIGRGIIYGWVILSLIEFVSFHRNDLHREKEIKKIFPLG